METSNETPMVNQEPLIETRTAEVTGTWPTGPILSAHDLATGGLGKCGSGSKAWPFGVAGESSSTSGW